MKNLINYYYNLIISEFKKKNEIFVFKISESVYEFIPYYGNVDDLYKNYLLLINNKRYCHEIIYNKDNKIITIYNRKPYVLLKKNLIIQKNIDLNEIQNYIIPVYESKKLNWKRLWTEKNDYYEFQINSFSNKYKLLKESINYYIGLSELSINLLNYIDENEIKYCVCHKRIEKNLKLDNFFNPVNLIIDSRTRDVAEYIKTNFFNETLDKTEVFSFFENINYNNSEFIMLLSRLIYPSYCFDIYDKIIDEKLTEEKLSLYIKKNNSYELFLKEIYNYLKNKYIFFQIEWFEN